MDPTSEDRIKVACRIRPADSNQAQSGTKATRCVSVDTSTNTVLVHAKPETQNFGFDYVGGEESTQEDFFRAVGLPITDACIQGYNGTILCYGQTGSGKTHTLFGSGISEGPQRGLVPRVLEYLWQHFVRENHRTNGALTFSCRCSFYEIYQEKVYDLLDVAGSAQAAGLNVREDSKLGVFIEGLVEEVVATSEDAARVLARGYGNRRVGETAMNRESSRSHAVFLLKIDRFEDNEETKVRSNRSAKFSLVDLAGSERQRDTNASGERLKEAGQINKSLSTLGNVINALASNAMSGGSQKKHIQYRDSKLTFLLRDSFGGNSKTLLIATASPNEHSMAETLSTLKFAKRAKMIKTAAVLNEESSGSINSLQKEITSLRAKIVEMETIAQDRILSVDGRKSTGRISVTSVPVEKDGPFSVVPNALPFLEALERCKVADEQCIRAELKSLGLSKRLEQADSFSMSLKMKLKMRDAEISKLKKKSEDEPAPSIEEIVKAETAVVREELQSEIIRLRAHCEDLERKLRADDNVTKWNCEKETKFNHETVESLASLRDTYAELCAKFEALRNDEFEATFGFPYASVGVLKTEHADLTVALREEQAKNSGLSHEAKVLLDRAVSTEKSLNDFKLELQRKSDSERIFVAQLNASIEELQKECVEKDVLINRLQSDLTSTSQSVQDDMRARELEHRAKYNAAMKDNMILIQKVRDLEFVVEKNEELVAELEGQVSSGLKLQELSNDAIEASRVQYAKNLQTLTDEIANITKALEDSQEVSNDLQLTVANMSTQAASQNSALRKTETELLQLQQAFDSLKMELENSADHIENLTLQNQTASDERDHLIVLSSSQKETIQSLEAQISNLRDNTIKDADTKFSQLMGQLEQERGLTCEVKTALSAAENSNHSLTNECQKLSQLCADNNEMIRSLQTVIQDLRVQLKSKDTAIEDAQQNLDDKMREIVSLVSAVDTLKNELSSVKEEKKSLVSTTLRSDKERLAHTETQIVELTSQNELLRSQLSQLETLLSDKDAEIQTVKDSNVSCLLQEQEKVIELEKQLRLAKSENANMSGHQNNKQKIQQHMQLKRDIEQQAETIKQLQEQIIHISVERDHAKDELKRVHSTTKDSILLTGGAAGLKKVSSSRKAAALSDIQNSASLQTLPAASAKGMSSKVINDAGSLDKAVFESL